MRLLDPRLFTILPVASLTMFSLDFMAPALGTSDILAAESPPSSPELGISGRPILAALFGVTVTVG